MSDIESMTLESGELHVIRAQSNHLDGIITCHIAAFPNQFLTLLGKGFLRCFYYFYIAESSGICLINCTISGNHVVGFVAGGKPELRSVFLRRYFFRFILTAGFQALFYRRVRVRIAEHLVDAFRTLVRKFNLLYPKAAFQPEPEIPTGTWSNLLSICVHPSERGRGVGMALMEGFRLESQRHGYKFMRLSVHNDNDAAMALYRKSGWRSILVTPRGTYFMKSVEANT